MDFVGRDRVVSVDFDWRGPRRVEFLVHENFWIFFGFLSQVTVPSSTLFKSAWLVMSRVL